MARMLLVAVRLEAGKPNIYGHSQKLEEVVDSLVSKDRASLRDLQPPGTPRDAVATKTVVAGFGAAHFVWLLRELGRGTAPTTAGPREPQCQGCGSFSSLGAKGLVGSC
jgi:hypothetical protein